jgi:methylase of polypeptide subunit release factors
MDHWTAPRFGQCLGALAAQLLHARSDHRKVVGGTGSGALAAQLLHACPDHRKIVSGAGSGHVSSVFS